jgi:replication initiation and membrane attachment protein DnaB
MIKIIIKKSNGKTIKSIFEMYKKLIVIELIVILVTSIREFTKLLIKAPLSPLFFAKRAIYNEINP